MVWVVRWAIIGAPASGKYGMRIVTAMIFAMTALGSMGTSAQTVDVNSPQRDAQKETCQKEARLIYRTNRSSSSEWRAQISETRKAYVQQCMSKAGFAS